MGSHNRHVIALPCEIQGNFRVLFPTFRMRLGWTGMVTICMCLPGLGREVIHKRREEENPRALRRTAPACLFGADLRLWPSVLALPGRSHSWSDSPKLSAQEGAALLERLVCVGEPPSHLMPMGGGSLKSPEFCNLIGYSRQVGFTVPVTPRDTQLLTQGVIEAVATSRG